ncbi:MAG: dTMP kinase [Candidatus Alcyoniella australis]|nr:dTMP kinase [Candidatus Alcyoniella australis]
MNAKLITFEGPEGAGKTTLIKRLAARLEQLEMPILITREPGGSPLGARFREMLLEHIEDRPTALTELLLYEADRIEHLEKIVRPALELGKLVLCDRFADATTAYQGYGRGLDLETVRSLNELVLRGLRPSRTYLLDLPVEAGLARTRGRLSADGRDESRFESEQIEFHQRVRRGYLELAAAEPQRFCIVDAQLDPEALYAVVINDLLASLKTETP